jgi:2-octaprenyl-6-methoxyphenol hydroxylase
MNVCIIGDGITSLSLAKNLINKKINVHIYHEKKNKHLLSNRTIGISRDNLKFFRNEIQELKEKNIWEIKRIEIFAEKLINNRILNFENNKNSLFYMVKNDELYNLLNKKLLKNKFFKKRIIKKNFFEKLFEKNNYDLIINCDQNNFLSKKYFIKKIDKDYNNLAYTTILEHEKLENNTAIQVFTNSGPIAFLPISNTKTSVVCSLDIKNKKYNNNEVLALINKHNSRLKIKKIFTLSSFKLNSSNARNYYYENILAFGDLIHRIHPLAGQGFNMTIRDIKILSKIIQNKIDLGIQLDSFVLKEFEEKTKNRNFIFSNGIDFIYEFFNFYKKTDSKNFDMIFKLFGKNKNLMNLFIKVADRGLNI